MKKRFRRIELTKEGKMIFKKYGFLNDKDLENYDKVTF